MQFKKFLIMLLISMFMFGKASKAQQVPTATTLKQGIYKTSSEHIGYYRNIKLLTPGKPVSISILDYNGNQLFFIRLCNENEHIKIGPIENMETLIVAGDGEISIIH